MKKYIFYFTLTNTDVKTIQAAANSTRGSESIAVLMELKATTHSHSKNSAVLLVLTEVEVAVLLPLAGV